MDPLFPPQSIQPVGSSFPAKKRLSTEGRRPSDSKIKGFFLEKIGEERVALRGALLPSAAAPRVVIDLLSAFAIPAIGQQGFAPAIEPISFSKRKRRPLLRKVIGKMAPIGLRPCRPCEWINAWIQFFLCLPSVPELLSFVPRSFEVFREFAEQYAWDQLENQAVSLANSASLLRSFSLKLAFLQVDLYEMLLLFAQSAFPDFSLFSRSVLFHPEWHLIWDGKGKGSFEEVMGKKMKGAFPDILVSIRGENSQLKRQALLPSSGCCYELDAFVERRPNGRNAPTHIAYVKVEGTWYQCDNERVTPLLSTMLGAALHHAILIHYKKIRPFF